MIISLQAFCAAPTTHSFARLTHDALRNTLLRSSIGGIMQIPKPSTVLRSPQSQDARGVSSLDAIDVFTHLMMHRPSSILPVVPGTATTIWLRALTCMSMMTVCVDLDRILRGQPARLEEIDRNAQELSRLHETVQDDIRTVSCFVQGLTPPTEKDLRPDINALQRIAAKIKSEEEQSRAEADSRSRITNLEMAQRSIAESRSTIACKSLSSGCSTFSVADDA